MTTRPPLSQPVSLPAKTYPSRHNRLLAKKAIKKSAQTAVVDAPLPSELSLTTATPRFVALFLFAATPLALLTEVLLSHDVIPKAFFLLIGAALLLFLLPRWRSGLRLFAARPNARWFLILAAAQAASLIASNMFSTQPALSFAGTIWRRFGTLEQLALLIVSLAIGAFASETPAWTGSLLRAMSVCGGIASLYGISQFFGFDPFLDRSLYAIDYLGGIIRPPATMGHAIYFSAYLVPIVLLSAASALNEKSPAWRVTLIAVAAAASLTIVLGGTRASLLALFAGGLILVLSSGAAARKFIQAIALIAVVAAVIVFSPAGQNLRHRFEQWSQDPGTARLGMWREFPAFFLHNPILGTGPETFLAGFRAVESAGLSRAFPDFMQESPHNAFLDAAAAQGIVGLLILIGLSVIALKASGPPGLRAAFVGLIVGCLFASFSLVSALYFWTIAGLLIASAPAPARPPKPVRIPGWITIPASALGALMILIAVALTVQDAAYADLRTAVESKSLPDAISSYNRATSFIVGLPGYELWSSQQMALLGRILGNTPDGASAWRYATEAASLAERRNEDTASSVYQSAILAIVAQDAPKAESKAREATLLAPNWYKPHLLHAQILQALGRTAEADAETRLCLTLGWKGK